MLDEVLMEVSVVGEEIEEALQVHAHLDAFGMFLCEDSAEIGQQGLWSNC